MGGTLRGTGTGPRAQDLTLVTGLWDLGSREGTERTSIDTYLERARAVLSIEAPLVVFADPAVIEPVRAIRRSSAPAAPTLVIERPLEALGWVRRADEVADLPAFQNAQPVKDTLLYGCLVWSKPELLAEVAETDPFGTTGLAWIDVGIGYVARSPTTFPQAAERVALMEMTTALPADVADREAFYRWERHLVAGGFFRGDRRHVGELAKAFRLELEVALGTGSRPTEQAVLAALTHDRPELFEPYYGGYDAILCNWDGIRAGADVVFANLERCRSHGAWEKVARIASTIESSAEEGLLPLSPTDRGRCRALGAAAAWCARDVEEGAVVPVPPPVSERRIEPQSPAQATQTVALCMIVRDEAHILERCLRSVRPLIDGWVIVDTGSSDGTPELIREVLAGIPGELHHRPWRDFGTNRTELMELARGTADYLLLLDADMTIEARGPLPALEADAYLVRHAGDLDYAVPRLVRGDRRWWFEGVTHEYLATRGASRQEPIGSLLVRDHADGSSRTDKLERDRSLLEDELRRRPDDPRTLFYLAQTLRDLGGRTRAIELYGRRADVGGWDEEVFYARYQQGRLLAEEDWDAAAPVLIDAWEERPSRAEPLYALAVASRCRGEHDLAYRFAARGARIPYPEDVLFVERPCYEWGLVFEQAIAAFWVGRPDEGLALNDDLLTRGLPPEIRRHVLENREHCRRALSAPRRSDPPRLISLDRLAGETRFAEVDLAVHPDWPRMNPSITSASDGFEMLVRTVNYRLGPGGRYEFLTDPGTVRSMNYLVRLDEDLEVEGVEPLVDDPLEDRPRHPSAVLGFEDGRLLHVDGRRYATATTREYAPDGRCDMALLTLDGAHIRRVDVLPGPEPGRHEKNWMPFVREGEVHALYTCSPTVVLELEGGSVSEASRAGGPDPARGFRGGSQGLPIDDGWLFVVHEVGHGPARRYAHRFVVLNEALRLAAMSPPFVFVGRPVEFCAGVARRGPDLILSFGVDDAMACLAVVRESRVLGSLEPVDGADVEARVASDR